MSEKDLELKGKMALKRPTFSTVKELNAFKLADIKAGEKAYRVNDSTLPGLFVQVGARTKAFKLDFVFGGKFKTLTIGKLGIISLAEARELAKAAKAKVALGQDPALEKQQTKQAAKEQAAQLALDRLANVQTFEQCYLEWFSIWKMDKRPSTIEHNKITFNHIKAAFGSKPIKAISQRDILNLLKRFEKKPAVRSNILVVLKNVFAYSLARNYIETNLAANIEALLPRLDIDTKHRAAIVEPTQVAEMLQKIDAWLDSGPNVNIYGRLAIQVLCLLPLRKEELLGLTWSEVDLKNAQITISKERMKSKKTFVTYLSAQALALFKRLYELRQNKFVFCGRGAGKHLSHISITYALGLIGISKEEQSMHGFRSTFSSLCYGAGAPSEVVEACLAHQTGSKVAQAYNRASLETPKRRLLQWYANTLDSLKAGNGMLDLNVASLYND